MRYQFKIVVVVVAAAAVVVVVSTSVFLVARCDENDFAFEYGCGLLSSFQFKSNIILSTTYYFPVSSDVSNLIPMFQRFD